MKKRFFSWSSSSENFIHKINTWCFKLPNNQSKTEETPLHPTKDHMGPLYVQGTQYAVQLIYLVRPSIYCRQRQELCVKRVEHFYDIVKYCFHGRIHTKWFTFYSQYLKKINPAIGTYLKWRVTIFWDSNHDRRRCSLGCCSFQFAKIHRNEGVHHSSALGQWKLIIKSNKTLCWIAFFFWTLFSDNGLENRVKIFDKKVRQLTIETHKISSQNLFRSHWPILEYSFAIQSIFQTPICKLIVLKHSNNE